MPPFALDPVAEVFDFGFQRPVLPADEDQILVAAQQVCETLGSKQHFHGPERAALVDLDHAPAADCALLRERILGQQQVEGDGVDLGGQAGHLPVQFVHDPAGCDLLAFQVGEFA